MSPDEWLVERAEQIREEMLLRTITMPVAGVMNTEAHRGGQ
jgi:hypothetical protein